MDFDEIDRTVGLKKVSEGIIFWWRSEFFCEFRIIVHNSLPFGDISSLLQHVLKMYAFSTNASAYTLTPLVNSTPFLFRFETFRVLHNESFCVHIK